MQTNILFVDITRTGHPMQEWRQRLAGHGVLVTMVAGRLRMLTHADVTTADIDTALDAWRKVAAELAGQRVTPRVSGQRHHHHRFF